MSWQLGNSTHWHTGFVLERTCLSPEVNAILAVCANALLGGADDAAVSLEQTVGAATQHSSACIWNIV